MLIRSLFVVISLKIVTAAFGDMFGAKNVLGATGISDIFDWKLGIPGFEGVFHSEQNPEAENMLDSNLIEKIKQSASDNLYFLFTRKNAIVPQMLYFNNVTSIQLSNFNPNNPVVVLSHGWTGNRNANLNPVIRDALLIRSDVNVIILDWSRLAYSNYITSTTGVPIIGQGLGMFLDFLRLATGASYDKMHLIGFSLGAHVVGNAGRHLKGKVARITALDPAGPLWHLNPNCVSKSDAVYVEGVHTNAGYTSLGIAWNVGHVDFYINGGGSQPGCAGTQLCSHHRAWELFAAAILHQHLIGIECTGQLHLTLNSCGGNKFPMGSMDLKISGSGVYRFNTDMFYPYKIV